MGSGKSTVAAVFQCLGIPIYDADSETKKMYDRDKELQSKLIEEFGEAIYPHGRFDRQILNQILVQHPEKWEALNHIVHPLVRLHSEQWHQEQTSPYTLRESALLFEAGIEKEMDKIIVVTCPEPIRIHRVMLRSGLDEASIRSRMNKQFPEEGKRAKADYILINDDRQAILPQILSIHQALLEAST